MKIQGQDLREIFARVPWQYKIVTAVGAAFLVLVLCYIPYVMITRGMQSGVTRPEILQISPPLQMAFGKLDPSLAADGKTAWLAYTSQEHPSDAPEKALISTRLAWSTAGYCQKWAHGKTAFESKSDDILGPDGQTVFRSGIWRVETPSLVYDPDDKGREWKIFAYKYFWADDPAARLQVAQHFGMIVYKYATSPADEWSTEQWLFSPRPDYPPPPYEQMVSLHLNSLDPSLEKIVTYARPSVIYKDGALVMTLSAFTGDDTPDRVVMITSADHGRTWKYTDIPLQKSDLAAMGSYTRLGGASLIRKGGQVYLAAVLGDEQLHGRGTFILAFDDLSKGLLQRDPKTGAPVILKQIPLQNPAGNGGFATYDDACPTGLVTAEQDSAASSFRIFLTHINPFD